MKQSGGVLAELRCPKAVYRSVKKSLAEFSARHFQVIGILILIMRRKRKKLVKISGQMKE